MSENTINDIDEELKKKHHEFVTDIFYPVSKFGIEYPYYLPIDSLKSKIIKKRTQILHLHYHGKSHKYHLNKKKGKDEKDRLLKEIEIYKMAVKILLHHKDELHMT